VANKQHITPVHPGEVLQDELDELNISQTDLAVRIGVLPKTVNEVCRGQRGDVDEAIQSSRSQPSFLAQSTK